MRWRGVLEGGQRRDDVGVGVDVGVVVDAVVAGVRLLLVMRGLGIPESINRRKRKMRYASASASA